MMTKEEILRRTNNGLDVFRHYVPGDWKPGKKFLNPFYEDRKASAHIWYCRKKATYLFKDFGNESFNGDCFSLVGKLHGWNCGHKDDFMQILKKIAGDLNIQDYSFANPANSGNQYQRKKNREIREQKETTEPTMKLQQEKSNASISVKETKKFSASEMEWWKGYGITGEILERYQVESIATIQYPQKEWESTPQEPAYLYTYGEEKGSQKIYCPHSRMRFVFIRKEENSYFGYDQLPEKGDILILTGGEKDVLTLTAAGFASFCLNSETADLPEALLVSLKKRFNRIVVLYDVDETGIRCSRKLVERYGEAYNLVEVQLPLSGKKKEKDISDYARQLPDTNQLGTEVRKWIAQAYAEKYEKIVQAYAPHVIDYNHPPEKPEAVVCLQQELAASPGDLICVTGGSGTGKSNYISCLIAGALNVENRDIDLLGWKVLPDQNKKALLYFDTEQSEYQSFQNLSRLLKRVGLDSHPEHLIMVNLCKTDRRKRTELIATYLNLSHLAYGGIYMVVIDGLADLISSVNEEGEAIQLVEHLQQQAQRFETIIAGVVHTAGVQDKVRGHLGSEITRKASAVISIENDKKEGHSIVKPLKLRAGNLKGAGTGFFHWDTNREYHVSAG